jgi:protocatechuate 3,4-dioxygenase beta subunit
VTDKPIHLAADQRGVLDVLISSGAAKASGVVHDSENRPVPNARVTLWSRDFYQAEVTRNDGSFDFQSVAPGEYRMLAWERIDPGLDAIPEFRDKFVDKAVTFKVDAGGHAHYEIPLIGRDAIQLEAAKLP